MQFWKKLKTTIVMLTVATLLLGQMPVSGLAAEQEIFADAPTLYAINPAEPAIYVDYLGKAASNTNRGPQDGPQPAPTFKDGESSDKGTVFWVGVRVTNLSQVDFLKNGGLRDLEIAFDYNPEYVVPCDDVSINSYDPYDTIDPAAWRAIIEKFNFSNTAGDDAWDSNMYELSVDGSSPEAASDTSDGREEAAQTGWKMQFISITKTGTGAGRFANVAASADADGYYLLKLPFQLKEIPTSGVKPLVFKLALGPGTLAMTNDTTAYAWEKTDRTEPEVNLKNIFQFGGDLNIFATGKEMTEFDVSYKAAGATNYTKAQLYSGEAQLDSQKVGFATGTTTYYITVPDGVNDVVLNMKQFTDQPTVTRDDYGNTTNTDTITATENSTLAGNWTANVTLKGTGSGAYKDSIKITVGGVDYLVHVKRGTTVAGEAKIVLDPGNSPYGLIERMAEKYHGTTGAWNEQKIADAKTNFVNEDLGNDKSAYQFAANFTPTNGDASVSYSNYAWEGSEGLPAEKRDNLDLDPNTQFIYSALDFSLAGFEATDSGGNAVDDNKVTITVQMDVMGDSNWEYLKDGNDTSGNPYVVEKTLVLQDGAGLAPTVDNNTVIALTTKGDGFEALLSDGIFVRPGVYDLTYSFKDASDNDKVISATRKLVVLWELGDCDLNSQVAGTDVTALRKYANGKSDPYVGVPIAARDLHKYRIIDVDYNSQIAGTDVTALRKCANGKSTLNPYYYNFDVTV